MANPKIIFTGVDAASKVVGNITGTVDKLKLALTGLASAAVVGVFRGIVSDLDALEESAQSAGLAVESLSALRYAALQAGVGSEALDEALKSLNRKLADAAGGGKEAVALFKSLGISAVNSSGQILNSEEALGKLADKFASFKDGPQKAALAVEFFGRAGTRLIPFLNQGSAGLERLREEAERAGVVFDSKTTSAASKFADALDRLSATARGAAVQIFRPLIDGLSTMIDQFEAARKSASSFGEALGFLARQSQQTLDDPSQKIAALTTEAQELQKKLFDPIGAKHYKRRLEEELGVIHRQLNFLKEIARQRALAGAAGLDAGDQVSRSLPRAPGIPGTGGVKEQLSDGERLIRQLQQELATTEQLTRVQEVQRSVAEGRLKFDSEGQAKRALDIARSLDAEKQFTEAVKASEDATKQANVEQSRLNTSRQALVDEITGRGEEAAIRRRIDLFNQMAAAGEFASREERDIAQARAFGIKPLQELNAEIEKQIDLSQQLGLTLTSSLGDLITVGGDASKVWKALTQDVAKLIAQIALLEPAAKELRNIFKDLNLGGSAGGGGGSSFVTWIGEFLKSLTQFAGGGFLRPGQFGIVGERGPELAYGGSTGQTIMPMRGGGQINVFIDGATDRARIAQLVERGVRAGQARMIDSQARGGAGL